MVTPTAAGMDPGARPGRAAARWSVAFGLSMVFHLALLWRAALSPQPPSASEHPFKGAMRGELRARLAAPPAAPQAPPARQDRPPAPVAPPPPRRPAPVARDTRPPPSVAARSSVVAAPPRIEGTTPVPAPSPPRDNPAPRDAVPQDMSAMLESRRRAREAAEPSRPATPVEAPPGAEDDAQRRERVVAANLGTLRAPSPGENQRRGGGVFQMRRVGTEEATFLFFGWNRDMGRNNTQQIEVRRGTSASIELAVVRRMIGIIREYESGDFLWESQRLGRSVTLSARAVDNASLEAFMLREFF